MHSQVQQLSELEEMLQHKQDPAATPLPRLVDMWRGRLVQAQCDAEVWQEVLSVRYLVAPPSRDVRTWLKLSSLCRKSGRIALSHKILVQILDADPAHIPEADLPSLQPAVAFAYIKQLWDTGSRQDALGRLTNLLADPRAAADPTLAAKG